MDYTTTVKTELLTTHYTVDTAQSTRLSYGLGDARGQGGQPTRKYPVNPNHKNMINIDARNRVHFLCKK